MRTKPFTQLAKMIQYG